MKPEPKTVLVIEDDLEIREALAEMLAEAGFEVRGAQNGLEALARLEQGPLPSVILLDLLMPIMDGWEFRQRQLSDGSLRKVPTVVGTASGISDAALQSQLQGVTLMPKPWVPAELLAVLRRLADPPDCPVEALENPEP